MINLIGIYINGFICGFGFGYIAKSIIYYRLI